MNWIVIVKRRIFYYIFYIFYLIVSPLVMMGVILLVFGAPREPYSLIPDPWQYPLLGIRFLMIIGFWAYFTAWTRRKKRQAGSVLLDLGRLGHIGSKKVKMLLVAFFVLCALSFVVMSGNFTRRGISFLVNGLIIEGIARLSLGLFRLSVGAFFVFIIIWNRLEIRENGIFLFNNFLKWKRIESYHWKGKESNILTIKIKGYLVTTINPLSISILLEHKDAVDSLLRRYLPGAEGSRGGDSGPNRGRPQRSFGVG